MIDSYVGYIYDDVIVYLFLCIFVFKQKTAYEMRISDWSSDVCSSDLATPSMCTSTTCAANWVARSSRRSAAWATAWGLRATPEGEIGRASCRERVCQYV